MNIGRMVSLVLVSFLMSTTTWGQTTYTWQGADGASWATGTNWNPTRTTPATNNLLIFNSGTTLSVASVPSQTVGRLTITNNTNITLQSDATVSLVAGNQSGDDIVVASGSSLTIGGSNPLTLQLAASGSADISGTLTVNSGRTYNSNQASVVTTVAGTISDAGTVSSASASKLVFGNGGKYIRNQNGGTFPTATWNTGSTCEVTGWTSNTSGSATMNQTYYNFIWNNAGQSGNVGLGGNLDTVNGTLTVSNTNNNEIRFVSTTSTAISMGTLTVSGSTSKLVLTSGTGSPTVTVSGDVSISSGSLIGGSSGAATLNVGGNWSNSGTFTAGTSTVTFNGSSAQTYTSSGTASFNNLTLNNNSGLTLDNSATVNGTLTLTSGNITTTSSNLLTLGSSSSVSGGSLSSFVNGPMANTWTASTATKTYPLGKGSAYRPLEISLTTPASPVVRAEMFNGNAGGTSALNKISTIRYYQTSLVSGTGASGGTVKVTFGGDDGVTGGQEANLVVAQSGTVSGTYATLGQSANSAITVTSSSYDPAGGDFLLLGSTGGNPLPVELASFTALARGNKVELNWATATEANNYGFEIERRGIGSNSWDKVGFVAGAGTSSSLRDYSYVDANLPSGRYAYRIKQIDNDGSYKYHGSAEVEIGLAAREFKLESNYPNPFNPSTTIQFTLAEDGKASLKVFNMLGQEVATLFDGEAEAGRIQQVKFDASNLPSGLYFAKLESRKQQMMRMMVYVK